METGKALNGKSYAGNPRVRFDEEEVASAAMPRRGSLLYTTRACVAAIVGFAVGFAQTAKAATVFETQNDDANVYTFGSPVESGETAKDNIGSAAAYADGRFAFRSGTVNVKEGGYVRMTGYEAGNSQQKYGNWLGANGDSATLNINGGVFWACIGPANANTSTQSGRGRVRIGVNDASGGRTGVARLNLVSGELRIDNVLMCGASRYDYDEAKKSPAEMNMSGGTAVINNFWLGARLSGNYSTAVFNLTGGEMQVNSFVFQPYHNQTFNWGSGTIIAGAANVFSASASAGGCTRSVSVTGNPAVFNTGSFAQTIPAAIANGSGTLKLTGGNTVTLSAAPSFGLWLDDGTTLAPAGGSLSIPASGTFTFSGNATVSGSLTLGSGASIVCNVDSLFAGLSATLTVTGGVTIPDGGSILDLVAITGDGAADCEKALSADGKTIFVSKAGDPDYIWNGSGTNWGDDNAWQNSGAAVTWADGNIANFNIANATAVLAADVSANLLVFNADAVVATNGTDAATLTVPIVAVAANASATISAPTAGPLAKTGAGVLTLDSSRSAATTLSEGTLTMSGIGTTLDWSNFTFGTDPSKPVTLRFADGATLNGNPSPIYVGEVAHVTNTLVKECGDWTISGNFALGRADGVKATFLHKGGTMTVGTYFSIGSTGTDHATLVICGGTVNSRGDGSYTLIGATSDATVVVTNGAAFNVTRNLILSNITGDGVLDVANGTVSVGNELIFGNRTDAGNGIVNLGSGGLLTAKNIYQLHSPVAEFNFNGGTLKAGAEGTLITASDNLSVTVGPLGGTIDNDGKAIVIQEGLSGTGTINLTGSGATAFAAGVEIEGGVSVATGTTLSLIGTAQTTFGSLTPAAGSTLKISSYTPGVTPLAVTTLNLPETGTVNLTLNGGTFPTGVYAIYSKSGVTAADGAKFAPDTAGETVSWSVSGDRLLLTVGTVPGNYWTGFAKDGRMSTGANWHSGSAPAAGADIDFSGVGAAVTVNADSGLSYGAVTMGAGVITFTNSLTATSFSDTSKVAVDANSTVTIDGDLVFSGAGDEYICYTVAAGGVFRVTGDIIASELKTGGYLFTCAASSIEGLIAAKGLVNNEGGRVNYGMSFECARGSTDANWEIGEHGLSGSSGRGFLVSSASHYAKLKATMDFENSAPIANLHNLELDTGNYTITLGNGVESRGGIMGAGTNIVSGLGKVVANYDIDNQTSDNGNKSPTFIVREAATLALVPGAEISKSGAVTVETGGCLEVAQSGNVSLGGDLVLANGAILGFNFTERKNAPVLAGAHIPTFIDGEATNVTVKVSGNARPSAGVYVLTACGGFDAEGVSVALSSDAPVWARSERLSVNADGNLVLDVKPSGMLMIVR